MEVPDDKRGDPWFDDGNIVLLTDPDGVAFKVHRGVLSRHSEVFQSMFHMPQPSDLAGMETLDGCQVVRMFNDLPSELSNLIKGLYDGVTFHSRNSDDFFFVAGILRLSTKYFLAQLRFQAIQHLASIWSYTLHGHDEMVDKALSLPSISFSPDPADPSTTVDITYPYIHPLHIINLARETNVRLLLPSAFYFLSLYDLSDILSASHPKLRLTHPSAPSSELALSDTIPYTLMFQRRLTAISDFIHNFCANTKPVPDCDYGGAPCERGFRKLTAKLSKSWRVRVGPMHFVVQAMLELKENNMVCRPCYRAFRTRTLAYRQNMWDHLPSVLGLPSWEELVEADLRT